MVKSSILVIKVEFKHKVGRHACDYQRFKLKDFLYERVC